MASLSHLIAGFNHPTLTPLTDVVNFKSLTILQRELNANASSVHSDRGTGTHGHLILACRPAVFAATLPAGVDFLVPTNPGPPPATVAMPQATRTIALAEHKYNSEQFHIYSFVDNALRQQIIKAVPETYIKALEDPVLGYSNSSALNIMTHLWDNYGTIDADELQQNSVALNSPTWNPSTPIESLFARIQTHAEFALAGGAAIPDRMLAQAAYSNVEATGLFSTYCDVWRAKPIMERTWANFKVYFTIAYKDQHRLTTSSAGFHSAHIASVKHDTTAETLEFIKSELLAMKLDIAASHKLAGQSPPPINRQQKFYCHTHGTSSNKDHTSATCNRKGPNHQDGATMRNKMGGSTKEWKPRA
jgi:hypothetical protein